MATNMEQSSEQEIVVDLEEKLKKALNRAQTAERALAIERQRFTAKYGMAQMDLIPQLKALKASLHSDISKLKANEEQILMANEVIKNAHHQLQTLRTRLLPHYTQIVEDEDDAEADCKLEGHDLDLEAEDFRLSMNKYFQEIKLELLSVKGQLTNQQRWDSLSPSLSAPKMREIRNRFLRDLRFGLSKNAGKRNRSGLHPECSPCLKVSDAAVRIQGIAYTLNWSASNIIVVSRIKMEQYGRGYPTVHSHYKRVPNVRIADIPGDALDKGRIWEYLADVMKVWMVTDYRRDIEKTRVYHIDAEGDIIQIPLEDDVQKKSKEPNQEKEDKRYGLGIVIESMDDCPFPEGTKYQDVVDGLQCAFDAHCVPLKVIAICTPSECALMSDENCLIGMCIADRTNAAYFDPKKGAIRVDWGHFDKMMDILQPMDLVLHSRMDSEEEGHRNGGKGRGYLEKMVSGRYIAELARLYMLRVFGESMNGHGHSPLTKRWGFTFKVMTQILREFEHQNHEEYMRILRLDLSLMEFTNDDGKLLVNICRVLCNRAADIMATVLAGLLEKAGCFNTVLTEGGKELFLMGKDNRIVIAAEGEVWKKVPRFKQRVRNTVELITNRKISESISMMPVVDGRDKGIGLLTVVQSLQQ